MPLSILFALLGILVGIVINRAADNLPPPARRSLFVAPRCPYCDTPRTRIEQSGILSYILFRNKCYNCGAPIPLRAPLVELATGLLFLFLVTRYPFGVYLLVIAFFTAVLLLILVIDIEHKLILNIVVLPATVLALLSSPIIFPHSSNDELNLNDFLSAIIGAVVGYAITLLIYYFGVLFLRLVNRRRRAKINTVAFGMGDVKLAGLLGALLGFPAIFYALFYAILLGGIGALAAILLRLIQRRGYSAFMAIPYGPYLILSGWVFLIWHSEILAI